MIITLPLYLILALPLGILTLLIGVGLGVKWREWEPALLILPFFPWLLLTMTSLRDKPPGNLIEVLFCGLAGGLVLVPRLFCARRVIETDVISVLTACAVGVLVYLGAEPRWTY